MLSAASRQQSVFLNVPFDQAYQPFFVTLVGTLVSLGQTPRCVLEISETGAGRLARIYELLRSCDVSIHDLSRIGSPARFNMPFELGMACGLPLSGMAHQVVVLDTVPFRPDKTLSDYKGRDPLIYHGRLDDLVDAVADVFQITNEPSPETLRAEARILRRSARQIAATYRGRFFGRGAFKALISTATQRAVAQGLLPA